MDKNVVFSMMANILKEMKAHPELVNEEDKKNLNILHSLLCKASGVSESIKWKIEWMIEKWHSTEEKLAGVSPYEVVRDSQNVVLDGGATEILNLITGSGTPYSNTNARIYVGTDSSVESTSQTGVIGTGSNQANSGMDTGYPIVNQRSAVFRASFGENAANFAWREASITNGTGANAVSMNRKVSDMGTKNGGTWTMQITINLVSA